MLQSRLVETRKHRGLRRLAPWLACLGLLVCAVFSFAWYFAARALEQSLDTLIAAERTHGRAWSCPERRITGFPFAIELNCATPQFAGLLSGKPAVLSAKSLRARLHLFHPQDVTAEIEAPLTLRSEDGRTDVTADWHSAQIILSGLPDAPKTIAFAGEALALHGPAEGIGTLDLQAARVDGTISRPADDRPRAYDFRINAKGVANPLLATALGAPQLDEFATEGTVTEVAFDAAARPAVNLEDWRLRNGHIDFRNLALSQAGTQIVLRGTLQLDAAHRPQGQFDTESSGLEPILRRYGINPSLVTAGVLLNGLLGGEAPKKPGALRLPLRLEGGNVTFGPVRTALRLPALY